MYGTSERLHTRLQLTAFLGNVLTFLLLALLSPGVLLLEPDIATAALVESAWTYPTVLCAAALLTWAMFHRVRRVVRILEDGSQISESRVRTVLRTIRRLHALPVRWVIGVTAISMAVSGLTLIPAVRPSLIDLRTQALLIALTWMTNVSATLPLYVVSRAIVARTFALIPTKYIDMCLQSERELQLRSTRTQSWRAINERWFGRLGRVRARMLYAILGPVVIVVLGASLLALAHVRSFERRMRTDTAYALARGVLDGDAELGAPGRQEALLSAAKKGFYALHSTSEDAVRSVVTTGEGGFRSIGTRIDDGAVVVRFASTSGSLYLIPYALVALLVIVLATLVGMVIGTTIARDLLQATRQVRQLGTREVLRGATRVSGPLRLKEVAALGMGIEQVAKRFREFARGQARMIDLREAAQRMRDLFLASMSHDLRSPLNGILGFIELLHNELLTQGQLESLFIIERRGKELLDLIENILIAAKIEAGRLELDRDWILPSEVLSQAVKQARDGAELKGIEHVEIIAEIQPMLAPIYIDGHRIIQALSNLLLNAIKFMDRGVVRVRVAQAAEQNGRPQLKFEVEDHGQGIPDKERAQLFAAFRRPLRTRRYGGLGLGLSLTRALTELHRGSVEVDNNPEGGCLFRIYIPLYTPEDGPLSEPPRGSLSDLIAEGVVDDVPTVQLPKLDTADAARILQRYDEQRLRALEADDDA